MYGLAFTPGTSRAFISTGKKLSRKKKKLDPYIIYHHKANIIFRENDIAIII